MQAGERKAPVELKHAAVVSEKPQCRAPAILADLDDFGAHGRVGGALPDLAFLETHRLLLSGASTIARRPARCHRASAWPAHQARLIRQPIPTLWTRTLMTCQNTIADGTSSRPMPTA